MSLRSQRVKDGHSARAPSSRRTILRLSLMDLCHEWILNLCLVLAVAAVFSPLLILFGLKNGTIQTLRFRLIQDPRNREVRPMTSKSFSREWFQEMSTRQDVAFIIPMTRQISATVEAYLKTETEEISAKGLSVDMVPTDAGDKLLIENGAGIPGEAECVLTASAAEDLGARVGSSVLLRVKRFRDRGFETGDLHLQVAGILHERASSLKAVYARLEVLNSVERFKDGMAVPEKGWSGSVPKAYPQYDGLVIMLPRELTNIEEMELYQNTGFKGIERVGSRELVEKMGGELPSEGFFYFLSTGQKSAGQESVSAVKHRLRGKRALITPWVKPFDADLLDSSGRKISRLRWKTAWTQPKDPKDPVTLFPPWDDEAGSSLEWRKIILPEGEPEPGESGQLEVTHGNESLRFPVLILPVRNQGPDGFISPRLGGVLNLQRNRPIVYEPKLDEFVTAPRGYAGFRLYAVTIDDVDRLKNHLEAAGIPVHTEAERIRHVKDLDNYLSMIFWLIAAVGITGGSASLIASLYAAVERKKKEMGVLRLLGVSKGALFRFPVYQGLFITSCGFVVGYLFYGVLERIINRSFSAHLRGEESLCSLSISHVGVMLAGMLGIAVLAGVVAAWRTTLIEPAEALRDE